jgi:ribonuclease J
VARAVGATQVIEVRNGRMVRLAPGGAERLDDVAHGRLYRDGRLLVSHETSGVMDRRRLSFAGVVSVAIVLSDSGDVLEDPTVALLGIPEADAEGELLRATVEEAVDDALDALPKPRRRDAGVVREAVRRGVRAEIDTAWGKKPQTIIHVTHVSD